MQEGLVYFTKVDGIRWKILCGLLKQILVKKNPCRGIRLGPKWVFDKNHTPTFITK